MYLCLCLKKWALLSWSRKFLLVWSPRIHQSFHKTPPSERIMNRFNSTNNFTYYSSYFLNVILMSTPKSTKWWQILRFSDQNVCVSYLAARPHVYEKTWYKYTILSTRWRSHLVRFQGCAAVVRGIPIQTAATRLPSVCLSPCLSVCGLGTKWWDILVSILRPRHLTTEEIKYVRTYKYWIILINVPNIWHGQKRDLVSHIFAISW